MRKQIIKIAFLIVFLSAAMGCNPPPSPVSVIQFLQGIEQKNSQNEAEQVATVLARYYIQESVKDPRNRFPFFNGPWIYHEAQLLSILREYSTIVQELDLSGVTWIRLNVETQ